MGFAVFVTERHAENDAVVLRNLGYLSHGVGVAGQRTLRYRSDSPIKHEQRHRLQQDSHVDATGDAKRPWHGKERGVRGVEQFVVLAGDSRPTLSVRALNPHGGVIGVSAGSASVHQRFGHWVGRRGEIPLTLVPGVEPSTEAFSEIITGCPADNSDVPRLTVGA